ncbi:MAG: hypothetical protein IPM63_04875 [Acidobacteriota bacterium]|nr:MAG: hypothetical protein IPM63_04875 [Acidobacteriota bacterium]
MSFITLLAALVLVFPLAGSRYFNLSYFSKAAGIILFLATASAIWHLGGKRVIDRGSRLLAAAGILLTSPIAIILLLWIGLGPPWEAGPSENRMRYLVLLADSMLVTSGFVLLKVSLTDAGEYVFSGLGLSLGVPAGCAYLVWASFETAVWTQRSMGQQTPNIFENAGIALDVLLFSACLLTYTAVAALSFSMRIAGFVSNRTAVAYASTAGIAVAFLLFRGVAFPDASEIDVPWYLSPGLIAGIPAVPWIIPYLFGVRLLREAEAATAEN